MGGKGELIFRARTLILIVPSFKGTVKVKVASTCSTKAWDDLGIVGTAG